MQFTCVYMCNQNTYFGVQALSLFTYLTNRYIKEDWADAVVVVFRLPDVTLPRRLKLQVVRFKRVKDAR